MLCNKDIRDQYNRLWELTHRQSYPESCLYVVATPIGNLADISVRTLVILQKVDTIACEDTRQMQKLLSAYGLQKRCFSLHQHNEIQITETVCKLLAKGQRVAYASDAGTPAISDPGTLLVAQVRKAGFRVVPIPGPCSVTTLMSAAGIAEKHQGFDFVGFLPSTLNARTEALQDLAKKNRVQIFFESPQRMLALAKSFVTLGLNTRLLTIGRELTKQFEEIVTMPCQDLESWLTAKPGRTRGEFCLLLHPTTQILATPKRGTELLKIMFTEGLTTKQSTKIVAKLTGESRRDLYTLALQIKKE